MKKLSLIALGAFFCGELLAGAQQKDTSASWVYPDSLSSFTIQEVVVTATEEKGVTATSKIGKDAISHIQKVCEAKGKLSFIFAANEEAAKQDFALGYGSVTLGMDATILTNAAMAAKKNLLGETHSVPQFRHAVSSEPFPVGTRQNTNLSE